MLHKQPVHTSTVNSEAQPSQFDFCFRFLLLHILAQGERIESVLFQPILAAYPTRHSWIISTHINLGTLHKPMHMFIGRKTLFVKRSPNSETTRMIPLNHYNHSRSSWTICTTYLWHTNQYFHLLEAYFRRSHHLMENSYLHREGRNEVFYPSSAQH